jgi:hypothetical protein
MADVVWMGDDTFGSLVSRLGDKGEQGKRIRRMRHTRAMK